MKTINLKTVVTALTFVFAVVASFAFTNVRTSDAVNIQAYAKTPTNCIDVGQQDCNESGTNVCSIAPYGTLYKIKSGTSCNTELKRD